MRGPDEEADLLLVEKLIFSPHGLETERFSHAETVAGRTPDFRVLQSDQLVAYCEVKSPRDDWLDEQLDGAPAGQIVGGPRNDPTFNRIARHIEKAATQFDAVNPMRRVPNILAFVNHDKASNFPDLQETLTGHFHAEGGERFETMTHISEGRLGIPKHRIDLYAWIDAEKQRVQGYFFNQRTTPDFAPTLCTLFGLDLSKIKY